MRGRKTGESRHLGPTMEGKCPVRMDEVQAEQGKHSGTLRASHDPAWAPDRGFIFLQLVTDSSSD